MAFKDIVGQDRPIQFLKNSIRQEKIATAYLFTGPEGVGKFLTAKNFAKALNCNSLADYDCCDICESCKKIESGNHLDILQIGPEGSSRQIKIEQIRRLIERINLKPYEAKTKVFIINNAHLMNDEASNCLLKTLEEPPGESVFILVTSNKNALFSTIMSRCQIIRFSQLGIKEVQKILTGQQYKIEPVGACFLSRLAGGSLKDITDFKDENILGYKNGVIDDFLNQPEEFLLNAASSDRQEIETDLLILLNWFRDILIFKITKDEISVVNSDRLKQITQDARQTTEDKLLDSIEKIEYAQRLLKSNLNIDSRLVLQNLVNQISFNRRQDRYA